jgi:lipopolysaccharide export system permease protein
MLPAILIYLIYLSVLIGARGAMDAGKWPLMPGLWGVHALFLCLALVLINWHNLRLWRQRYTGDSTKGAANA